MRVPSHVAIIMDGNGRWAESRGLPRHLGHEQGATAVRAVVSACRRRRIPHLTLFAFSAQNWQRPRAEVVHLMALLERFLREERDELHRRGVRVRVIGDRQCLPAPVLLAIELAESTTRDNTGLWLTLAVGYGGREDVVRAARALVARASQGLLTADEVDEARFTESLMTAPSPPVDLLIRTSGEAQTSNFLLWEAAFAELHFTPCLWPDFDESALQAALDDYASRERRFGQVSPCQMT